MRTPTLTVAVLLSLTAAAGAADATKPADVRAAVEAFVKSGELVGAVAVVGTASGVTAVEAVGGRTLATGDAMQKDSLFRIASMTKPIIATAFRILADEGKLSIDDPVEKHLPEFKGQMLVAARKDGTVTLKKPSRPITIRDLCTHTSGLPNYPAGLADLYTKRTMTLSEATVAISQRPLDFEPGSKWSYCNPGIDTLGRIVEVASGKSLESFLADRIFTPLGMKDTTFYPTAEQAKRIAGVFHVKDGKLVESPMTLIGNPVPGKTKHPIPAGGLYSTGGDIARFYRMMLNEGTLDGKTVLSKAAVKDLTSVHTGDLQCGFTDGMAFGLGFAVVKSPTGITENLSAGSFGHGGAYGTQSWADPKKGVFFVLLIGRTGLKNGDASDMRRALQKVAVR